MLHLGCWLTIMLDDQPWPGGLPSSPVLSVMEEEYIAGNGLWRICEITGVIELTFCRIQPETTDTVCKGGPAAGGLGLADGAVTLL